MSAGVRVYLSLGSNVEPGRHLPAAVRALEAHFGALTISPVYESEAVGFSGANFLNLVVGVQVSEPVGELSRLLRAIEDANGRVRSGEKFSSRTLDIDILTYGQQVGTVDGIVLPRDEIEKYAFVIRPLADIDPEGVHPLSGDSYAVICQRVAADDRSLWPVELELR